MQRGGAEPMILPYWLIVILAAIFFWRISAWLGIEDFACSWKGGLTVMAIIAAIAALVNIL